MVASAIGMMEASATHDTGNVNCGTANMCRQLSIKEHIHITAADQVNQPRDNTANHCAEKERS